MIQIEKAEQSPENLRNKNHPYASLKSLARIMTLSFAGLLAACGGGTQQRPSDCLEKTQGYSSLPPCWINSHRDEEIVIDGPKHIGSQGWQKARQLLLNEAIVEFATRRYGQSVSIDTTLIKEITVQNQSSTEKVQMTREAHFNHSDQAVTIKARIKDYFYDTQTERVWLLVVENT